jgi:hypothetical protein
LKLKEKRLRPRKPGEKHDLPSGRGRRRLGAAGAPTETKPEEKAADKSQDPALKEAAETKPEEKAADKSQALALKDTDAKSRLVVPRGFTSVTRFSFMSQCKLYPVFATLVPDLVNCNMSKSWSYSFTLGLPKIRHTALLAIHELLNGVSIFQACYLLQPQN